MGKRPSMKSAACLIQTRMSPPLYPHLSSVSREPRGLEGQVSERFIELGERFEEMGAAGLLVLQAAGPGEVERRHGEQARPRILQAL